MAENKCSPATAGCNPTNSAPRDGAPSQRSAITCRPLPRRKPAFVVHLCIPDDQIAHFPQGQAIPTWPLGVQPPRIGEVIYLTSTSAWVVSMVVNELVHGGGVRIEAWLDWIGASRHRRVAECTFTH